MQITKYLVDEQNKYYGFSTRIKTFLILIFLSIITSACGTVQHSLKLEEGHLIKQEAKIEVADVLNESGRSFEVLVEPMFQGALKQELSANGLLWTSDLNSKLILACKILDYEEGNAFKRWMLPGWGSTQLKTRCELKDENRVVGNIDANRSVAFGGGFTVGAWASIFNDMAEDIVKDIQEKLDCPDCEGKSN